LSLESVIVYKLVVFGENLHIVAQRIKCSSWGRM